MLQSHPDLVIIAFNLLSQFRHHRVYTELSLVQRFYKEVPNLGHEIREAEKSIRLGVFYEEQQIIFLCYILL